MKYFRLLALIFVSISSVIGQDMPTGMKYNGSAFQENGNPIINQRILVQIKLQDAILDNKDQSNYIEHHYVTTNKLGLFSLIIGSGDPIHGAYSEIPWSEKQIWISIELDIDDDGSFDITQKEQLLAVPYAIHSNTASNLINSENRSRNTDRYWATSGNKGSNASRNFIGTIDNQALKFRTNNIERMTIESSGNVDISSSSIVNLTVQDATINKSLDLGPKSLLSVNGSSIFNQGVQMNDYLKVDSKISLSGDFHGRSNGLIDLNLDIGQNLSVSNNGFIRQNLKVGNDLLIEGKSTFNGLASFKNGINVEGKTELDELIVRNNASIGKNLTVSQYGIFKNRLTVEGQTTLNDPLVVNDVAYLNNNLLVRRNAGSGKYIATFENTNKEDGGGIKIKLGKKRPVAPSEDMPIYTGPLKNVIKATNTVVNKIVNQDTLEFAELFSEFFDPAQLFNDHTTFLYATCYLSQTIGNSLVTTVNNTLDLPWNGRDILVGINGYDPEKEDGCFPYCSVGDWFVPDYYMEDALHPDGVTWIPKIPTIDVCSNLPFDLPQIPAFPDLSIDSSSLTSKNNFIVFTDEDDNQVGAITGLSKNEFATTYLDELLVLDIAAEVIGLDPLDMAAQGANQVAQLIDKFNTLGVEYTSGHGDYAEWLPRVDKDENISTGDIIAVKGGKITKNLTNAEQIMAISHRPIVLGNVPHEDRKHLGNNVAFMGQIPVKVMGPIEAGDYIVALNDNSGYGKGYNEDEMTLDFLKHAVGRSWDTNLKYGPKLVNTVVGVSSGDYIKFISKIENNLKSTQKQLDDLSTTVSHLNLLINSNQSND